MKQTRSILNALRQQYESDLTPRTFLDFVINETHLGVIPFDEHFAILDGKALVKTANSKGWIAYGRDANMVVDVIERFEGVSSSPYEDDNEHESDLAKHEQAQNIEQAILAKAVLDDLKTYLRQEYKGKTDESAFAKKLINFISKAEKTRNRDEDLGKDNSQKLFK